MLVFNAVAYIFKSSLCLTLLTDMVPASVIGQWLETAHIVTPFEITIFGPSNPAPLQVHGGSGLELYVSVLVCKMD